MKTAKNQESKQLSTTPDGKVTKSQLDTTNKTFRDAYAL